ncbi:MAG: M15 family metallopeptidase [Chloroflexota bacterium]
MNSIRQLGLAVAFALSAVIGSGLTSGQVAIAGSLPAPACSYDDVLTKHRELGDWRITLLDPKYMVSRNYVPPKLVSTSTAGLTGGGQVRRFVIPDLTAMATAARKAGATLRVMSAYRSWSEQRTLYRREVQRFGERIGRQSVARPGHSEHQLGTTIDFTSGSKKAWGYNDWAKTPAGAWIKANGWKYGFVLSYPDGKKAQTCYRYEPWHWRYIGREMAAKVKASGLTLREYLWKFHH